MMQGVGLGFFFPVLGIEPRASCMTAKRSTSEIYSQSLAQCVVACVCKRRTRSQEEMCDPA